MTARVRRVYVAEPSAQYRVQPPLVVDSSMICALLFDEPERHDAEERLAGRRLYAPRLLDHEVAHVAVKKSRRGMRSTVVERALADYLAQAIELVDTEVESQFALAMQYKLSGYDAAYLWLAAALKSPLATFDKRLGQAAKAHLSALE